jgi:hypothetical protein
MQNNDNIQVLPDFIEEIDSKEELIYSDTDSAYLRTYLGFNKFDDVNATVQYIIDISKEMDATYIKALNYYLGTFGGVDPEYNTMNFKSELIATKGFFNAKKYYSLAALWVEGNFMSEPEIKNKGGQIAKSDKSQCTDELLNEIYHYVTLDQKMNDKDQLEKLIFTKLAKKYTKKIQDSIQAGDLYYFALPKRWGKADKVIPKWITGAKLYNFGVEDYFRPGDSLMTFPIKLNLGKVYNALQQNGDYKKFGLTLSDVNTKLDMLSIPTKLTEEQTEKLKMFFDTYQVKPNYDEIINFNIELKLDQFRKLF